MPTQYLGVLLHTMAISGLPYVRTELVRQLILRSLPHHPVQTNCESAGHSDLGDLPPPAHHQVKVWASPFRDTAHCGLCCLPPGMSWTWNLSGADGAINPAPAD